MERKVIIPRTQTGFRKEMGIMDNIYVLNYVVNRQIGRAGRKLVALFVDLRAAFDLVDKGVLVKTMKGKGIREELVRRVKEVIKETRSRVRAGREIREGFWMARGRQECPLSPLLFNILLVDIEEEIRKIKWEK